MHKYLYPLLIISILLAGLGFKANRYQYDVSVASPNDWQIRIAEKLSAHGFGQPQLVNVTSSADVQALMVKPEFCRLPFYIAVMPGHDEWIALWELIADSQDMRKLYLLHGVSYQEFPRYQYWQSAADKIMSVWGSERLENNTDVYAVMYASDCEAYVAESFELFITAT